MNSFQNSLVVCGTDTDVGKTVVSAMIVQGLNAIYWKPIQSGLDENGDTGRICKILDLPKERYLSEAYKFKAAVSPHWAAEQENRRIDESQLQLPLIKNQLVIETAGGVMVPLSREWLQINQLQLWKLPVILVARSTLGTLNHTLLTLEALRTRGISTLGIVLNGPSHSDNPKTLEQLGGVPIIGHVPPLKKVSAKALHEIWITQHYSNSCNNAYLETKSKAIKIIQLLPLLLSRNEMF